MALTRNSVTLNMVADRIEKFPDHYDQDSWFRARADHLQHLDPVNDFNEGVFSLLPEVTGVECATTGCLAGWAVAVDGWDMLVPIPDDNDVLCNFRMSAYDCRKDGRRGSIPVVATEVFGMSATETSVLFSKQWRPIGSLTVPDALRALAGGASLASVTDVERLPIGLLNRAVLHADDEVEVFERWPDMRVLG